MEWEPHPENALKELNLILANGAIWQVYSSINEWLTDFWPSYFAWTDATLIAEVDAVLQHPDFPRFQQFFQDKYGFDLKAELEAGKLDEEAKDQ